MDIKIQSLKFDADGKLLDFIESKVSKLEHFHNSIIGIEITLRLENSEESGNKLVDVKIFIPGNDLFASRHGKTFEEATDLIVDVLKQQLKKVKEKQKTKW